MLFIPFLPEGHMPLDSQTTTLWIQPTGGALGADVHGIDLSRDLDRPTYDMLADAWAKHFVLRFSGQKLDDDALMRFSRNWGELDRTPVGTAGQKVNGVAANAVDWIAVISNVKVEGKPIGGLGAYESVWHTDMSYNPLPPRASLLYALECPSSGGDTGFCNMELAYETLSEGMKKFVHTFRGVHDSLDPAGHSQKYKGMSLAKKENLSWEHRSHPLVRTHPVSGRKALFVNEGYTTRLLGVARKESDAVLSYLFDHLRTPEFQIRHHWRKGDLVVWDNRITQHYAVADYGMRRLMYRITLKGDRPV